MLPEPYAFIIEITESHKDRTVEEVIEQYYDRFVALAVFNDKSYVRLM